MIGFLAAGDRGRQGGRPQAYGDVFMASHPRQGSRPSPARRQFFVDNNFVLIHCDIAAGA